MYNHLLTFKGTKIFKNLARIFMMEDVFLPDF